MHRILRMESLDTMRSFLLGIERLFWVFETSIQKKINNDADSKSPASSFDGKNCCHDTCNTPFHVRLNHSKSILCTVQK